MEQELIQDILNGNKQRYAEIVENYQGIVANLCYRLAGDRLDVEEVSQQVFVELYLSLPRFKFQSKLSTFIYSITVNVVMKMLKKDYRYVFAAEDASFDAPSSDHNPEQRMVTDERMRQFRYAITRLKREQKIALVLYTYKDLSYQEIADIMGVSLPKVESLIFRARKNLKKLIVGPNED